MKKIVKGLKKFMKGFTILETLIAISVSALLVSVALSSFTIMRNHQVLKSSSRNIASAMQRAQSLSISSVDSSAYGVHFELEKIVIFKGQVYSPTAADNEIIAVYPPAQIVYIYFNDGSGGSDVYFDRLTGAPSYGGYVMIRMDSWPYPMYRTIYINNTGTIQIW